MWGWGGRGISGQGFVGSVVNSSGNNRQCMELTEMGPGRTMLQLATGVEPKAEGGFAGAGEKAPLLHPGGLSQNQTLPFQICKC